MGAEHIRKGLKAVALIISEIPQQHFFSKHIVAEKVDSFIPRALEIPTSKFSRVLNTMAKVSKLYLSPYLRFPTAFSQNTFLLRKWLSFILRAPEIPNSKISRVLNTMVNL